MTTVIIGIDVVDGHKALTLRGDSGPFSEATELTFPFPLNDDDCDRAREICRDAEEVFGSSSLDFPDECGFTADDVSSLLTDIFGQQGTGWVSGE